MDAFTIDTPADAAVASYGELLEFWNSGKNEIISLQSNLKSMTDNWEFVKGRMRDLQAKIDNAATVINGFYSENGYVNDDLAEIATFLDIPLTKEISGTATFSIYFSARVPLNMDPDDFELSFDVNCETYDVDDFDWEESGIDMEVEEN